MTFAGLCCDLGQVQGLHIPRRVATSFDIAARRSIGSASQSGFIYLNQYRAKKNKQDPIDDGICHQQANHD